MIDPISMAKTLQFVKSGALSARPDKGEFAGQMYFATDVFHTIDILQIWDGRSWRNVHYVHKDVQDDLEAIAARQTWTIQTVVDGPGIYDVVKAGKHPRMRILSAYAHLGDTEKETVIIRISKSTEQSYMSKGAAFQFKHEYLSEPVAFDDTATAGEIQAFDILEKGIIGFWKELQLEVTGKRKAVVGIVFESAEVEG